MQGMLDLFFPKRCVYCTRILQQNAFPLCLKCFNELPLSHWKMNKENPAFQNLAHEVGIEAASALLLYTRQNSAKKLIMANKYYNMPEIGVALAVLSKEILQAHIYEVITCVPSHKRTLRTRGYNQVTGFAAKLAELLDTEFRPDLIKRVKRRDSQTHKTKKERLESLGSSFEVSDEISGYASVLLLDDVFTTGATLSNCCRLMLNKTDIKIYVFTMAKVI